MSVFGVDLDRGKKRQKVTEGLTCLPLLQLCIPSFEFGYSFTGDSLDRQVDHRI